MAENLLIGLIRKEEERRMGVNGPIRKAAAAALLLMTMQAGCGGWAGERPAEETLSLAANGLHGVDRYAFRVRTAVGTETSDLREIEAYEGEIVGHSVMKVRRSSGVPGANELRGPTRFMEELLRQRPRVEYAGNVPGGRLALRATLEGNDASRIAGERIRLRFEQAARAAEADWADGSGAGLTEDQYAAYRDAVKREIARSRQELERMLSGLSADTEVDVTIDRRSLLPLQLVEKTVLRYESGGRQRTERQVTQVILDGFDGRPQP